ncbi:hypothetical protein RHGRI_018540 [Rhododendron griersonianum]|uniref:Uncharacterized protein n=1 Tax=Rhododendron griersonianum TaxID=479676 RepID=A0AAV6K202_9ERIC|nr:hypothetical protein RHGRI_018540 [Rhododendron griersonianum]
MLLSLPRQNLEPERSNQTHPENRHRPVGNLLPRHSSGLHRPAPSSLFFMPLVESNKRLVGHGGVGLVRVLVVEGEVEGVVVNSFDPVRVV